jgi:acyl-CoA synthetase (AMP-forming)/AMP-acid ligase II
MNADTKTNADEVVGEPRQVTVVENGVRRVVEVTGVRKIRVPAAWKRKHGEHTQQPGPIDDVINVSGHRISTTEVERALIDHRAIAEAAVVGKNDDLTGQAIVCFVTLREGVAGTPELGEELRKYIGERLGQVTTPKYLTFLENLPKTRTGEIMRRILRDIAEGRMLGGTTTLPDSKVAYELRQRPEAEAGRKD